MRHDPNNRLVGTAPHPAGLVQDAARLVNSEMLTASIKGGIRSTLFAAPPRADGDHEDKPLDYDAGPDHDVKTGLRWVVN